MPIIFSVYVITVRRKALFYWIPGVIFTGVRLLDLDDYRLKRVPEKSSTFSSISHDNAYEHNLRY